LIAIQNSLNSNDDDDLPAIAELLSGVMLNNVLASTNSNCDDDDGFLDIDELLTSLQQKSISASTKLNSGGLAEKVDDGTQGSSPVDSSYSTRRSTQGKHIVSQFSQDFLFIRSQI
jgi:hypothetical protein